MQDWSHAHPQPSITRLRGPFVEAIDRALILLSALSEAGPSGQSLGTLCEMTAIHKPTAYRALATMKARGFVAQTPTGEYRIGPAAITLGAGKSGEQYLVGALKGVLSALSRRADELVHLGTWHGDHVVYLDKVEPATRAIRVWSSVGQQVPIASSALGRALLGATPRTDEELHHFLEALPEDRSVSLARLREAVDEARTTGFASETEENEPGVACIARAILRDGEPIAALSVTSLASRVSPARASELRKIIDETVPPLLPDGLTLYAPGH